MNKLLFLVLTGSSLLLGCGTTGLQSSYESASLRIVPLTKGIFVHISYLDVPDYGLVPCNGMIVVDRGEAIVFDTPTTDSVSAELIDYIERDLTASVKAVVPTHFHHDCLGGLRAFHDRGIPSYANRKTMTLAQRDGGELPQRAFDDSLTLKAGRTTVINRHFGAGHTADNIVCYVLGAEVLFGGCLIKADGAGKGNLADATPDAWPATVARIAAAYPGLRHVIPGHGAVGGAELLTYTYQLFSPTVSEE